MRFFIFQLLFFSYVAASANSFTEKHVDPFLERATDTTSVKLALAGTISVFLAKPEDDQIRNQWVGHQQMSKETSGVGDLIGSGAAGVLLLGGQALWDDNESHYQSHFRALVYTTMVTSSMKYGFGRSRPGNSDSHQSFPSGHTSISFATATSLTYAYGWKAAVIAYPVASFVALSRLADDAHWTSDLVGGAFVGFLLARASSYDYSENRLHELSKLEIYPVIGHGDLSLKISYLY
ncbi:MAG: phosphatase PAP2 family protein [Bdellovibrio sp.]|nr:phosphatase PAP2 family protein [Bdellovibrio sp.]